MDTSTRTSVCYIFSAVVALAVGILAFLGTNSWFVAVFFAAITVPLAANGLVDALTSRLVRVYTYTAIAVWLIAFAVNIVDQPFVTRLWWAVLGLIPAFVVWAASKMSKGRLVGAGDSYLLIPLGGWAALWGAGVPYWGLWVAVIIHWVAVITLVLRNRSTWWDTHPFGPSLICGFLFCSLFAAVQQW